MTTDLTKFINCDFVAPIVLLFALGTSASAFDVLNEGHVDFFDVAYLDSAWEFAIHDEDSDIEYDPATTLLQAKAQAETVRPGGSEWDFLGVGAGAHVWVLPQVQDPEILFGGLSTEEMPGDFFDEYLETDPRINESARWIKLTLEAVRGPGEFSVWSTGTAGPTVWGATSDGLDATDALFSPEGSHVDYNWGFTAAGLYEVDLTASAYLGGDLIASDGTTYNFEVVPEPGTMLALGTGLAALIAQRRKASSS